ncbi:unnamed protein product [Clonostachys rosea f. rosea IK726]|uniref:Uncharacterized protein n=1 Tax=Clonostachys rosea f. rosea IK726 TaxID=1349383 RepID=A0ACA9UR49_BIOOC|nr:unnamed protein product [Clonostachys rosea f. rosea IK726]
MGISAKTQPRKQEVRPDEDLGSNANLEPTNNISKGQAKNDPNSRAGTSSSKATPIEGDGASRQNPQLSIQPDAAKPPSQQSPEACKSNPANNPEIVTQPPAPKQKQASLSKHAIMHTVDPDNAIESDSEGDSIDESAIDDDDSSDWEDSIEDSGKSSVDDKYFQRVDSKVNLTSRRSLITLMLTQTEDRAKALSNHASQSTPAIPQSRNRSGPAFAVSPNDSDDAPLMMKGNRQAPLKPIREIPRSSAQPMPIAKTLSNHASQPILVIPQSRNRNGPAFAISPNDSDDAPLMMKGNCQAPLTPIREIPRSSAQPIPTVAHGQGQGALSPRATRRNMLATELTESLRRHLLWERSQKFSTANAVLKRRHTSHDVAYLKQFPEKSCMKKTEDVNASSWNQYFVKETFDGYHSKGW